MLSLRTDSNTSVNAYSWCSSSANLRPKPSEEVFLRSYQMTCYSWSLQRRWKSGSRVKRTWMLISWRETLSILIPCLIKRIWSIISGRCLLRCHLMTKPNSLSSVGLRRDCLQILEIDSWSWNIHWRRVRRREVRRMKIWFYLMPQLVSSIFSFLITAHLKF